MLGTRWQSWWGWCFAAPQRPRANIDWGVWDPRVLAELWDHCWCCSEYLSFFYFNLPLSPQCTALYLHTPWIDYIKVCTTFSLFYLNVVWSIITSALWECQRLLGDPHCAKFNLKDLNMDIFGESRTVLNKCLRIPVLQISFHLFILAWFYTHDYDSYTDYLFI